MKKIASALEKYIEDLFDISAEAADFIAQDEVRLQLVDALTLPVVIGTAELAPVAYICKKGKLSKLSPLSDVLIDYSEDLGHFSLGGHDFKFLQDVELDSKNKAFEVSQRIELNNNFCDAIQSAYEHVGFMPGPFLNVVTLRLYQRLINGNLSHSIDSVSQEILTLTKNRAMEA